jgi:transposase
LAKLDKKRSKKGSNKDWKHPSDREAQIMKMKNGSTHLAHKLEHAVDLSGKGAVLSVTLHGGAVGDTKSLPKTLNERQSNLGKLIKTSKAGDILHKDAGRELVADKGYHGNAILESLIEVGYRTYISEPDRGGRKWKGKKNAQRVTYANRRRVRGERGRSLLRKRGELLERPFAHYLEAGGMRRTHLRGPENILKRLIVHVAGFDLGILMRHLLGKGTPREYAGTVGAIVGALSRLLELSWLYLSTLTTRSWNKQPQLARNLLFRGTRRFGSLKILPAQMLSSSTGS